MAVMKTKLISILLLGAVLSSCSSTQDQNSPAPVKEKAVSKKDPVKVIKADIIDYSYQIDSGSNSSDGVIMLGIQSFKLESNNIKRVALRFFENRDQDSVVVKEETFYGKSNWSHRVGNC